MRMRATTTTGCSWDRCTFTHCSKIRAKRERAKEGGKNKAEVALKMSLSSQWWRSKLACNVLVVPTALIALDPVSLSSELAAFEYTNVVGDQRV